MTDGTAVALLSGCALIAAACACLWSLPLTPRARRRRAALDRLARLTKSGRP
jgi:hypothetical protein